jgi:hypothetical protein
MNEIEMVQDRKTGEWYNPQEKWEEVQAQPWFIAQLKRMKDEAWEEGYRDGQLALVYSR